MFTMRTKPRYIYQVTMKLKSFTVLLYLEPKYKTQTPQVVLVIILPRKERVYTICNDQG
jgi:hypothetical protein